MKCDVCGREKGFINYGDAYTIICKDCYGTDDANKLLNQSKKRMEELIISLKKNSENKKEVIKSKPESFIFIGVILFIIGLVSILTRAEITVKILGSDQIMTDAILGGSSTGNTLAAIIIIGCIAMIIGIISLIKGLLKYREGMNQ